MHPHWWRPSHHPAKQNRATLRLRSALRETAAEFTWAELLDSLIIRPACLYVAALVSPATWLLVAAKLLADAAFYAVAYTTRRYRQHRQSIA